jgi:hypothetical protein
MKLLIVFCFLCIISAYINNVKYLEYLNNNENKNFIEKIIKSKQSHLLFLNGLKIPLKKDFCHLISKKNNIPFEEWTMNKFMCKKPILHKSNHLFYIKDFDFTKLNDNSFDKELLFEENNKNIIICNIHIQNNNINNIDDAVLKKFRIVNFTDINITKLIFKMIDENSYNSHLKMIDWNFFYGIQELNLEKINILLFELDSLFQNNVYIQKLYEFNSRYNIDNNQNIDNNDNNDNYENKTYGIIYYLIETLIEY